MPIHTGHRSAPDSKIFRLLESEKRVLGQVAAGVPIGEGSRGAGARGRGRGQWRVARIHIAARQAGPASAARAAPNLPAAYNEAIHGVEIGEAVGSCGTAAHRGEAIFVTDIATDPLWGAVVELPLAHGLRACWSIPIRGADGRLLGTFGNYYREPRSPTADDLEVIAHVTHTAALVIERHLSDQALRESEQRFRALVELSPQVVLVLRGRRSDDILQPVLARILGPHSRGDARRRMGDAIHPDHPTASSADGSMRSAPSRPSRIEIPSGGPATGNISWLSSREPRP